MVARVTADVLSITLALPAQPPLLSGASIRVSFTAVLSPGDIANATAARLVPYFDGAQYGAEIGFSTFNGTTSTGDAFVPLPPAFAPGRPADDGPCHPAPPPAKRVSPRRACADTTITRAAGTPGGSAGAPGSFVAGTTRPPVVVPASATAAAWAACQARSSTYHSRKTGEAATAGLTAATAEEGGRAGTGTACAATATADGTGGVRRIDVHEPPAPAADAEATADAGAASRCLFGAGDDEDAWAALAPPDGF
jgi:hypothetical protein